MTAPKMTAAEREREEREETQRKTRVSMRLGALGVVVLFACGFGVWLVNEYELLFLGGMVVGVLFLLAAFFLVRGFAMRLGLEDRTKIY